MLVSNYFKQKWFVTQWHPPCCKWHSQLALMGSCLPFPQVSALFTEAMAPLERMGRHTHILQNHTPKGKLKQFMAQDLRVVRGPVRPLWICMNNIPLTERLVFLMCLPAQCWLYQLNRELMCVWPPLNQHPQDSGSPGMEVTRLFSSQRRNMQIGIALWWQLLTW